MLGSFIAAWPYVGEEIFRRLAMPDDELVPSDVFADIARTLADELRRMPVGDRDRCAEAYAAFRTPIDELQDKEHIHRAMDVLEATRLPDFVTEDDVLSALESIHELLNDDYSPQLAVSFRDLVAAFICKFNLPYKVRPAFHLAPLISAQATRIYDLIEHCPGPHGDHPELWEAFEEAYFQFTRNKGDRKTPIHKITSYLEAVAIDRVGSRRSTALGKVLAEYYEKQGIFPHKSLLQKSIDALYSFVSNDEVESRDKTPRKSLSNLYDFTSDYPAIRHSGNPAARNRELLDDDTFMLTLLLFVWAGYIHTLPVASPA